MKKGKCLIFQNPRLKSVILKDIFFLHLTPFELLAWGQQPNVRVLMGSKNISIYFINCDKRCNSNQIKFSIWLWRKKIHVTQALGNCSYFGLSVHPLTKPKMIHLKFGRHTVHLLVYHKLFFCFFFEIVTQRADSLEKMPYHVDLLDCFVE